MACKHFQQEIHDFIKHAKSHPVTYEKENVCILKLDTLCTKRSNMELTK